MSIPWNIETHDVMPSTQDAIKAAARAGKGEGTVIHALEQTAGYGRHGRAWVSEKGNFYLSLLLKPAGDARHVGQLGILTGLAAAETIRKYIDDPKILTLKWPNDVMLEDIKCAGIIVETELTEKNALSWVGVGIGVNITSAPHGIATSLDKHSSKAFGLPAFRTAFLTNMDKYYTLWGKEGFGPIRQKWLEYAHQKGSRLRVRIGPQVEEGIFFGIDDEGGLLLEGKNQRIKKITAGEIYL